MPNFNRIQQSKNTGIRIHTSLKLIITPQAPPHQQQHNPKL